MLRAQEKEKTEFAQIQEEQRIFGNRNVSNNGANNNNAYVDKMTTCKYCSLQCLYSIFV